MSTSSSVSIVICTYNGAARLAPTLAALASQTGLQDRTWEVLIVDNASTDDTLSKIEQLWPRDLANLLRVVHEPRRGQGFARERGYREVAHSIISFIDDDNWVSPDWVRIVSDIFTEHPEVAACGGKIDAEFESPPPFWFQEYQAFFAVGAQQPFAGDITGMSGNLLWGAGLSIRRKALDDLFTHGFVVRSTGRSGTRMSSGDDTELCFALRAAGWRLRYDDRLWLKHYIPSGRLRWEYALRLFWGIGHSTTLLDLYVMALPARKLNLRDRLRETWGFQLLKCLKNIASLSLSHPVACVSKMEGSQVVVALEYEFGRLVSLWTQRRDFSRTLRTLKMASWNRAGGAAQGQAAVTP